MNVPDWWAFVLLALAAYRVWRLLAEDTILDPVRERLIGKHEKRLEWLTCPFCLGFWIVLAWWAAWLAWPYESLVVAVPFALSAAVGVFAAHLDP